MKRTAFLDSFSRFAGGVTRRFPKIGAKVLDAILFLLVGNFLTTKVFAYRNRKNLKAIARIDRILVISDIHIGDAILIQPAVSALRDFFPEAQIDYLVKKSMEKLLEGNPDVSKLYPLFTGGQFPNDQDLRIVREMSLQYDAVFNLCPFLTGASFPEPTKVFHAASRAPLFVQNERNFNVTNHIAYQAHCFIRDLLLNFFVPRRDRLFEGPGVFLQAEAISEALDFFKSARNDNPIVFLNPDTASAYTRIPVSYQSKILEGLTRLPCLVFLGEGHTEKEIGKKLLMDLPPEVRHRVVLVPSGLSLEAYTALTDWSDIFISGDTGPLHLAAARKNARSCDHFFRNQTTVLSVFGATPPRFSGYESARPGFMKSPQKAESHSYQSISACRNLTCMHKMAKECDAAGCFKFLDVDEILNNVRDTLSDLASAHV